MPGRSLRHRSWVLDICFSTNLRCAALRIADRMDEILGAQRRILDHLPLFVGSVEGTCENSLPVGNQEELA